MTSRLARAQTGSPNPAPEQLDHLKALYDENVRYTDERIGELLDDLAQRNLLNNTLVVLTADHGEAFGEHGDLFHGWNLYDELLRVPLVISGGPLKAVGSRKTPVSLVDLAASILSLLRISAHGLPGRMDLFAPGANSPEAHATHAETRFRGMDAASIVEDGHKLILHRQTGKLELYDLRSDPGETQTLHFAQNTRASRLKARLQSLLEFHVRERQVADITMPPAKLSPQEVEELRALGYLP
jgi:arylsulfatase A-like enzyme